MKIHHIGYLVKHIEEAIKTFLALGYIQETDVIYDSAREIHICFLIKDGYRIELVCPCGETSVVSGLYKKFGNTPYHICYESEDYEQDILELRKAGFSMIDQPQKAVAINNIPVAFFWSLKIGMIEVINKDKDGLKE